MLFNLFGAVAVAGATALMLVLLRRHFWRSMPGWLIPAVAGIAMVTFSIWNSYAWFDRVQSYLAEGIAVAYTHTTRSPMEPWTYLWPRVERFAAVDLGSVRSNPEHPELRLAEVIFFTRFRDAVQEIRLIDCARGRMADPPAELSFDDTGAPIGVDWATGPVADGIVATACKGG